MKTGYLPDGVRVAKARMALLNERGKPMTQVELAAAVGIHPGTMNRIENTNQRVSLELLERLCDVLRVDRAYLLNTDDAEHRRLIEQRERLAEALLPLGDVLLEIARTVASERESDEVAA